jgi:hypothetical protein
MGSHSCGKHSTLQTVSQHRNAPWATEARLDRLPPVIDERTHDKSNSRGISMSFCSHDVGHQNDTHSQTPVPRSPENYTFSQPTSDDGRVTCVERLTMRSETSPGEHTTWSAVPIKLPVGPLNECVLRWHQPVPIKAKGTRCGWHWMNKYFNNKA